jgi:hypothetical protein
MGDKPKIVRPGPYGDPLVQQGRATDAITEAEELLAKSIREQAAEFVPDAVSSLGAYAKGETVGKTEPTASVVRQSARDIIEFAGGRPETRDPRAGGSDGSVNIFITKYGGGDDDPITIDGIAAFSKELAAQSKADAAPNGSHDHRVTRSYEVHDAQDDPGEAEGPDLVGGTDPPRDGGSSGVPTDPPAETDGYEPSGDRIPWDFPRRDGGSDS